MVTTASHRAPVRRAHRAWFAQLIAATLVALLAFVIRPPSGYAQSADEYEVKAAFLYNFAKFVEWPVHSFPEVGQSFLLCVYGDDPFGGALERTVAGKSVQERSFAVRHVTEVQAITSCHMVFVSWLDPSRLHRLLTAMESAPVLVVGDTEDVAYGGGMIAFRMEGNRVRFVVNQDAVARAGLQVSSQLLKVADKVLSTGAVP
jgi:hypothetical protein